MTMKEIRALSLSDLQDRLGEFREELFKLRFQHATAQLENTARIPQVKTSIARILTVLGEKQGEA